MKIKHIFWAICSILIMSIIFSFSNQNGVDSASISMRIAIFLHMEKYHGFIRKLAHFSIYFALGFTSFMAIVNTKKFNKKPFLPTLIFCLLNACFDEFHQLFILGRSGQVKDVFIDCMGAILCICILSRLRILLQHHPKSS